MKTVVILQSNYIPWKGYFDLIRDADEFVFLDDVQFTKNDWRNRNKLKTPNGAEWISIPVGDQNHRKISQVEIPSDLWQTKHWKTIKQNYGKCQYFEFYRPQFEDIYLRRRWVRLSELNQYLIRVISVELLGLTTGFFESSECDSSQRRSRRLIDILLKMGAKRYVSGPAAKDYIDPRLFAEAGIELVWKNYSGYPKYPQRFPPFEHGVSILDLLFNVGPNAPWYIWGWREGGSAPE
jgi:hypothetical protein